MLLNRSIQMTVVHVSKACGSSCSLSQRFSMRAGTFRDDTIIGWVRRELVHPYWSIPDAAVLSCHAPLLLVTWRDKIKIAVMQSHWLAMPFKGDLLRMQNISLQLRGNPFSLGLPWIPPDCRSFRYVFKLIMQSKETSWYNLSSKKKKAMLRGNLRRQNILENL